MIKLFSAVVRMLYSLNLVLVNYADKCLQKIAEWKTALHVKNIIDTTKEYPILSTFAISVKDCFFYSLLNKGKKQNLCQPLLASYRQEVENADFCEQQVHHYGALIHTWPQQTVFLQTNKAAHVLISQSLLMESV